MYVLGCGAGTLALMVLLSQLDQHQTAPHDSHNRLGVRSLVWLVGICG
jgi:hypothetical protein